MSEPPIYTIYQPESDAPQPGDSIECRVIGAILTPYKRMEDCPSRHNKREFLPCTIQLAPEYAPGLVGLEAGGRALVLYWLHLARRDMVQLPAREGVRDKPVGVFSMRTPPRPNPIAASVVEILAAREGELDVAGLDCLDGTPLLDIKRARFYEGSRAAGGLS
ncbi:MAG: SAM-dependent methyltransferase [Rhodospirillaceae bacterium]|jgi:tRNA-Thr(GGU) m(6)t(6)A37 methyltransferase TsaA|nr:SAM-dependent methyltransferase [Rhodospirillaceae bacterium]MBT5455395.1 SAM-dependent methyltransferase [Rhodospirillaceae bacterium]